jgi:hypothetical protein
LNGNDAVHNKKKLMKTVKLMLAVTAIGVATLSAHAGVRFGFSVGLPLPVPVFVAAPAAPVIVTAPVVCAPNMVMAAPVCPGPDYVWSAGYWRASGYNRVYVPGGWNYRPTHVVYAHGYDHGYDRGYGYHRW